MTTIKDIDSFVTGIAPRELSEAWDNDGVMLCGDTDAQVKKALVCLEVNLDAVKRASETGASLIVTHHPFIFKPLKNVRGEYFSQIELLMKNSISVLSYHTRFDKAKGGVNDILAQTIGLCNVTEHAEFLRVGELDREMSGEEFAKYIREKLGCGTMKAYFDKNAKIKRVSVCGGAGKDFLPDAAGVSDAYVSADLSHNTFIDAKDMGISIFDAGHYFTENPAVYRLADILKSEFNEISFETYDVGSPYFTI